MSTPNFHVFSVKRIGATSTKPALVKIKSELHRTSITFSFEEYPQFSRTYQKAQQWLTDKGFKIIGTGESDANTYLISETFEDIK